MLDAAVPLLALVGAAHALPGLEVSRFCPAHFSGILAAPAANDTAHDPLGRRAHEQILRPSGCTPRGCTASTPHVSISYCGKSAGAPSATVRNISEAPGDVARGMLVDMPVDGVAAAASGDGDGLDALFLTAACELAGVPSPIFEGCEPLDDRRPFARHRP